MNKFMKFLALVLVMGTLLAFAACAPNDTTTTTAPNNSTTTKPNTSTTTPSSSTTAPAASSSTEAPKPVTYRVKVVDEEGNPVAGARVQLCKDACVYATSNDEGWAEFTIPVEDGYHANILKAPSGFEIPEGKELDKTEYDFESGKTEMTLVLKLVDKA